MNNDTRIAIVGGGPGGLTLATILAKHGIPSTVFELDEHPGARPSHARGGSLDLHEGSGLLALEHAGLLGAFNAVARYDDQADAIYDHHGVLHYEHVDTSSGDRPEIDRAQLRQILLESLPSGTVRWGEKLRAFEPLRDGTGRIRLTNANGTLGDFDLVVGADGAWSKVRPLVSPATPEYTGVLFIELTADDVDARHLATAALVPRGKVSAVGKGQGIIAQRSSNGHVRTYLMFRAPEDWIANGAVDLGSPTRARAQLKAHLAGWSPRLLTLIDECNDLIVARPIVALPVGHRWEHRAGVTLLGDAAHVMPPFSGEGVNMAMLDAAELARALIGACAPWGEAVAAYEAKMFVRAAEAAKGAMEGLDFLADDALPHLLEHFRSMGDAPVSNASSHDD